jgi:hypothetical protein
VAILAGRCGLLPFGPSKAICHLTAGGMEAPNQHEAQVCSGSEGRSANH